jgi:TonB family protein
MPLRCLLFSSNEQMVQPIWQVLVDLGIEGEYCPSAVDAVERVTTQLFQIVITDWDDQPEAGFLLKTARDQKAANRPLTLAIVSDESRLPAALKAGANSVLVQPIQIEQVRDTMSTACDLLRSRQNKAAAGPLRTSEQSTIPATSGMAAAAAAPAYAPTEEPISEKIFRAGEFLQTPGSAPGAQFDIEAEAQNSINQEAPAEVEALSELESAASAVVGTPAPEQTEPRDALTGWAALQARLTKSGPPAQADASPQNELQSYRDAQSFRPSEPTLPRPVAKTSAAESSHEAALFAYIDGQSKKESEEEPAAPRRVSGPLVLVAGLALVGTVLFAIPKTRARLAILFKTTVKAGSAWLNPHPVPTPQTVTQHESFGQEGDEYKLPASTNVPEAATDPSQIRIVPVIDPTAKPPKNAESTAGAVVENPSSTQTQNPAPQDGSTPVVESPAKDQSAPTIGSSTAPPAIIQPPPTVSEQPLTRQISGEPPAHLPAPHVSLPVTNPSIPSSLRSQTASTTPEASGNKPVEAALASIEPVNLPESAAWELLAQPVEPIYPDAAKASKQQGKVSLQVLIDHEGAVQDAKFLQGSFLFAKAAIDAVKQWRFKPYQLNGRVVSVQTVITVNFKPPA